MQIHSGKLKVLEHAAFWLFMWLFVFDYHFVENNWGQAILATGMEVFTYAVIVYLNLLLLIPLLLKRKHALLYIASIVSTVAVYVLLLRISGLEKYFYDFEGWRNVFSMVINTSLFLLISFLYWYFKQWRLEHEQQLAWKNEKLEAELNFLRSQISPHFIFNTLNNIYTLALRKDDSTAPMVAKLSTLLRYVLYEGGEWQIFLKKETETLRQYIELQLLRKPISNNVDFYTEGNPAEWKIAPMLLINFVENAFKHSRIDHDEDSWIKIHSNINSEGKLSFSSENSAADTIITDDQGGIGLQNVRRQLELFYPRCHTLTVKHENGIFSVQLNLQLRKNGKI